MIKKLYKAIINLKSNNNDFAFYVSLSVLSGILITFANWQENHFMIVFIIYFSLLFFVENQKKIQNSFK